MEWNIRISSNALATIIIKKMNSAELLPLTEDLLKLNKYLSTEIQVFQVLLQHNPCETVAWIKLAKATLAKIILFNKRRGGEPGKMTLKQYANTPDWQRESTQELQESLTTVEKHLAKNLKLVQVVGKRGRVVPVLLTNEVVSSINVLISTRVTSGVSSNNEYVFARPYNESLENLRGHDAIREMVVNAKLESPESITSTKLRKYLATVSQIFNLQENEMDWLARHLGHDI